MIQRHQRQMHAIDAVSEFLKSAFPHYFIRFIHCCNIMNILYCIMMFRRKKMLKSDNSFRWQVVSSQIPLHRLVFTLCRSNYSYFIYLFISISRAFITNKCLFISIPPDLT
uniref:Ovule protein n=1 Tax=Ascaris lumbricoides TaxID=6252 RepID=A0A0M3HM11_ASCLU